MTSELLFFGSRESGNSYKVALMLALTGTAHLYVPVDIFVPHTDRPELFRSSSKFGEVPTMVTEDGEPLCQSSAILTYLAERTGRFGSKNARGWRRIREWLAWEMDRIGSSLPNLRFARRFAPETSPDVVLWLESRLNADLTRLDQELDSARPFLLGEPTIADIACAGYLFWPEQAGIDLDPWKNVRRWLKSIASLPGFREPSALLGLAEGRPKEGSRRAGL